MQSVAAVMLVSRNLKKGGDRVMSVVLWIQLKVGQSEQAEGREAGRNRRRRG